MTTTDTPNACPHCGATDDCMCFSEELKQALAASKAEVERLKEKGFDLVEEKLKLKSQLTEAEAENVCLQELIQEFYTEQEVREIMNRYHDLLNK